MAYKVNEPGRNKDAANYFRENVHRLQLGNLGLIILKKGWIGGQCEAI